MGPAYMGSDAQRNETSEFPTTLNENGDKDRNVLFRNKQTSFIVPCYSRCGLPCGRFYVF